MTKKVYVEGTDTLLKSMWLEEGWIVVNNILCADLLCLEGGADVSPEIYGEANTYSSSSLKKDLQSFGLLNIASLRKIPVVGICRGSQVLCVATGGKMKQHIEGHGRSHKLTYEGVEYEVSSSHHQESVPAVSEDYITRADDGTCEIVEYYKLFVTSAHKWLGFQPHPEYHKKGHECRKLFFELIDRMMQD